MVLFQMRFLEAVILLGLLVAALVRGQHPVASGQLNAEEVRVKRFIDRAEVELLKNAEESTFIEWAYSSNITDHNEKVKVEQQVIDYLID